MPYQPGDLTKGVAKGAVDAAKGARRKFFEEAGKHIHWWDLPLPAQLAALAAFREDLREFNLYGTETAENGAGAAVMSEPYWSYASSKGPLSVLLDLTTGDNESMPLGGYFAEQDFALQKVNTLKAFTSALNDAKTAASSRANATAELVAHYAPNGTKLSSDVSRPVRYTLTDGGSFVLRSVKLIICDSGVPYFAHMASPYANTVAT